MRQYNILVTGVGAIIGYGIIGSLRRNRFPCHIVGMDIYPDAVGQHWCDEFVQAILAYSDEYVDFITKIMDDYRIDLVFFGTEQEIYKLDSERERLRPDILKKLVLNQTELLALSQDKWKTHLFLEENHIHCIPTKIEGSYEELSEELGNPFLFKPRASYASKGIMKIECQEDLAYIRRKTNAQNFMVQKIVGDNEHEYTVGVFGLGDGTFQNSIALRRKLSPEGSTVKAERVEIKALNTEVERLVRCMKPVGPTNLQFRLEQDKFLLLEVNPRISSSTSIRMELGYNESEMCLEYFLNGQSPTLVIPKDGRAVRYIQDMVTFL